MLKEEGWGGRVMSSNSDLRSLNCPSIISVPTPAPSSLCCPAIPVFSLHLGTTGCQGPCP